jgi:serine protease Do
LNLEGELVGITTATAALTGGETAGGFAVPLDVPMRRIVEILRRGEEVEYGFLGITVNPGEIVDPRGVIIEGVADETPAARAGLSRGEILRSINGNRIRELDDMFLQIAVALAGSDTVIEIELPNGTVRKVTVPLARFSNPFPSIAANRPNPIYGLRVDYGSVLKSDGPIPPGVSIRELEKDSIAERKLKELNEKGKMIIVSVNGKRVATPSDFYREARSGKGVLELRLVEVSNSPTPASTTVTLP